MSDQDPTNKDEIRQMVRQALNEQIGTAAQDKREIKAVVDESIIDESGKSVITESDIRDLKPASRLLIREDAIITPSANDAIRERGIELRYRTRRAGIGKHRIVALGSDHGGFETKEQIKAMLKEMAYEPRDFGTVSNDAVDYPDFAHAVAKAVADGACELGIIVDGAGIGSCMTANKVPGVRAAMCYDEATARNSREHNYANVLTLGGRTLPIEKIRQIVTAWLATSEGEERHGKRVAKIMAIEKQYLR